MFDIGGVHLANETQGVGEAAGVASAASESATAGGPRARDPIKWRLVQVAPFVRVTHIAVANRSRGRASDARQAGRRWRALLRVSLIAWSRLLPIDLSCDGKYGRAVLSGTGRSRIWAEGQGPRAKTRRPAAQVAQEHAGP
jgi:hypothetical protein